jgi:N-acyltransferase N-terminal domain
VRHDAPVTDADVTLPTAAELPPLLLELTVPHEDIDEIVAAAHAVTTSRDGQRLLTEGVRRLLDNMGAIEPVEPPRAPPPPPPEDPDDHDIWVRATPPIAN